jgi:serine/threonine-protein kinase
VRSRIVISTIAGTGAPCPAPNNPCGDGGRATSALFNDAHGVAALPDGGWLVVDRKDNRIRGITADGVINTVAGTGATCDPTRSKCGSGGPATAAQLNSPIGVELTAGGGYLVLDGGANQVRYVSPNGSLLTIAGSGAICLPTGPAPKTQEKATRQSSAAVSGACGDGGPALLRSSSRSATMIPAGMKEAL